MIMSALTMCLTVSAADAESRSATPTFKVWKFDETFSIGNVGSTAVLESGCFGLAQHDNGYDEATAPIPLSATVVAGSDGVASIVSSGNAKRAFSKSSTGIIDINPADGTSSLVYFRAPVDGTYYYDVAIEGAWSGSDTVQLWTVIGVRDGILRDQGWKDGTAQAVGMGNTATFYNSQYTFTGSVTLTAGQIIALRPTEDGSSSDNNAMTLKKFNVCKVSDASYTGDTPDVTVKDYVELDSNKMWLILNKVTKLDSSHFSIDVDGSGSIAAADMFWSDKYQAYCYLVISESKPTIDSFELSITNGSAASVNYGMDINMNGTVEINDAQFAYNMYNAEYASFSDVSAVQFLGADVNGDMTVDISDVQDILEACYGTPSQTVSMWTEHGFDRMTTGYAKPSDASGKYTVYMAKNEDEGVHIALRSENSMESLRIVTLSGGNADIEHRLYYARPITIEETEYTDALIPLENHGDISLTANKTTSIYVDFKTSADTPAGDYPYEFALVDENGNVLASVKVTVHVWNFELYSSALHSNLNIPTFETAVGMVGYSLSTDRYEMLLDFGLSPMCLPYDILDSRADKYMSDPRVTSFQVPHDVSDETLQAYYRKLTVYDPVDNPNWEPCWLEKAFFYPADEPDTKAELDALAAQCQRLEQYCPDVRITCPSYTDIWYSYDYLNSSNRIDQIEFMDRYIDLHCPKIANWNDTYTYDDSQYGTWVSSPLNKYGSFADRIKEIQTREDNPETVWAYVCNEPNTDGYLNLTIDDAGRGHRILFWQMFQRDIEGFLYWSANSWVSADPWDDVDAWDLGYYGDGILVYPGGDVGLVGQFVPSIRLVAVRDGIEDIELLYLAEQYLGSAYTNEYLSRVDDVSSSLTSICESDDLATLRIDLGNAIEQALGAQ